MEKRDKIEEIFQENFKDFKVQPDPTVWSGIQAGIPGASPGLSSGLSNLSLAGKVVIGLAVASGVALSAYFLQDEEISSKTETEEFIIEKETPSNTKVDQAGSPLFADTMAVEEEVGEVPTEQKAVKVQIGSKEEVVDKGPNTPEAGEETAISEEVGMMPDSSTSATDQASLTESSQGELQENTSESTNSVSSTTSSDVVEVSETSADKEPEVQEKQKPAISKTPESSSGHQKDTIRKINAVIPNIFTPNQDGMNDVFRIETEDATDLEVTILDKSGKIVFEWKGLYGFWDGSLPNGNPAAKGDYIYRVLLIKNELRIPKTDWVRLER